MSAFPYGRPVQEEDRLQSRMLWWVIGITVVIIVVLALWAWWLLSTRMPAQARPIQAPARVDIVEQTLIGADTSAAALNDRKRRMLESYGWVDRTRRIARIPIEQAMEMVVAREGR